MNIETLKAFVEHCDTVDRLAETWIELKVDSLRELVEELLKFELNKVEKDPCPNCHTGVVCKTPLCGRLKQPATTEYVGKRGQTHDPLQQTI